MSLASNASSVGGVIGQDHAKIGLMRALRVSHHPKPWDQVITSTVHLADVAAQEGSKDFRSC